MQPEVGSERKAIAACQRVLREFTGQAALTNASRNNLAQAYGIVQSTRDQDLLKLQLLEIENQEKELQLGLGIEEERLQATRKKVLSGLVYPSELPPIQLEVERIKFKLSEAALRKSILLNQIKK
jgi:hypothetical protein